MENPTRKSINAFIKKYNRFFVKLVEMLYTNTGDNMNFESEGGIIMKKCLSAFLLMFSIFILNGLHQIDDNQKQLLNSEKQTIISNMQELEQGGFEH